jgi:integrase
MTEQQIRVLLSSVESIRDDALIRLGLSIGLRVSEIVDVRTSEIEFDRGLTRIWDEKKDKWRLVMPTLETIGAIRKYLNSAYKQPQYLFPVSAKTVERIIQGYSKRNPGFDFQLAFATHHVCLAQR